MQKQIEPSIIPAPRLLNRLKGSFALTRETVIICNNINDPAATNFAKHVRTSTGYKIPVLTESKEGKTSIEFRLDDRLDELAEEAYQLKVDKHKISITSASESGLFYGCQTLLQLFHPDIFSKSPISAKWLVPCIEIEDTPRFKWRGLMIDIARHFYGVETLMKIMEQMAYHKLNRLHLHLSDDQGWRIEIPNYPKLTTIGATGCWSDSLAAPQFLTVEDVGKLVAYAKANHIIIIPEIDMPGHSGAINRAYPEMSGGHNTINVSSDRAMGIIQEILSEIMMMFESPYMHFGGDEVRDHEWHLRPDMQARLKELHLTDVKELEGRYDRNITEFILSQGKRPICWDEAADFGIDKQAIVQWWRCLQPDKLIEAIHNEYEVIISPPDYVYFDYPYVVGEPGAGWEGIRNGGNSVELIYHWNPIPNTLSSKEKEQILGIEACVWTEFIKDVDTLEYMIFPRLLAFCEQAWSTEENMNYEDFKDRLNAHLPRYKHRKINYRQVDSL